jgi:uncharacterized membrane protein YhaH (DUF805 family)
MNFASLFMSFEGRISRKTFWLGLILLFAVGTVVLLGSLYAAGERDYPVIRFNIFVITVALLYPTVAVGVKRLHDRGRPGYTVLVFLVPWILHQITNLLGITGDPTAINAIDMAFILINLVLFVWFVVDLGILRGTVGPNEYGPDPVEAKS